MIDSRKIRLFWNENYLLIFLVIFNLIARFIYCYSLFDKTKLNQNLPGGLDRITLLFVNGSQYFFPTTWSSYHLLLALIYYPLKLFNFLDFRLATVVGINIIASSITILIVYKTAKLIFPTNKAYWFFCAGLLSLYYPSYYFNLLTVPESLFGLVLASLLYCVISPNLSLKTSLIIGVLLALSLLMKPVTLALIAALTILLLAERKSRKHSFRIFFYASLVFIPIILIGSSFNFYFDKNHIFTIAGNGGANFTLAWCEPKNLTYTLPNGETSYFAPPIYFTKENLPTITTEVGFYNQLYYYQLGLTCLKEHPERLITNLAHVVNIWSSTLYPNFFHNILHRLALVFWKWAAFLLIIGFGLFPLINRKKRHQWSRGAVFLLSLIAAVYFANPGEERYLVPYFFILALFGLWPFYFIIIKSIKRFLSLTPIWKLTIFLLAAVGLSLPSLYLINRYQKYKERVLASDFKTYQFLVRGNATRDQVVSHYHAAAFWLIQNQKSDGSFNYEISLKPYRIEQTNNSVRQLLAAWSLAKTTKYFNSVDFQAAHKKSLRFVVSQIKNNGNLSYAKGNVSKAVVSETAFAALTLVDSPEAKKFDSQIKRLGEFILAMQKQDGSFNMLYPLKENQSLTDKDNHNLQKFASGETALACIRLFEYTQDQRYHVCAQKAFTYYYPLIKDSLDPSFNSWHAITIAQLIKIDPKSEYKEAVVQLSRNLIKLQNQEESDLTQLGGFDQQGEWYSSAEAVYVEAIGRALKLEPENLELNRAYQLGLKHLISLQIAESRLKSVRGAIIDDAKQPKILVDNISHSLITFNDMLTQP